MSYDYTRTIVINSSDTKIPTDLELNKVIRLECNDSKIKNKTLFNILSNMTKLEDLVCRNSKITDFPKSMLNLIYLDCSKSKIESLPENMPNLNSLHCSNNRITKLPNNIPKIKFVNCSNNKINELPDMPELKELNCANNKINELPDMPKLEELNCDYTLFANIKTNVEINLPKLQIASAKSNESNNIQDILNNIIKNNEEEDEEEEDEDITRRPIKPVVLEQIDKPINKIDKIFDPIDGDEINLIDYYMSDNSDNIDKYNETIVFYDPYIKKNYIIYKNILINAQKKVPSDIIFYKCKEVDSFKGLLKNDDENRYSPLLQLLSLGIDIPRGFLPFEYIEYILNHPEEKFFVLEKTEVTAPSTVNEEIMLFPTTANRVSASHCQRGRNGIIYKLKIINYSTDGGNSKKNKETQRKTRKNKEKQRKTKKNKEKLEKLEKQRKTRKLEKQRKNQKIKKIN